MRVVVTRNSSDCSQLPPPPVEDLKPIIREEVKIVVASLKKGKSAGVDNILVQAGRETMTDVLTEFCNRIWRTGEWSTSWTQSLVITLPKQNYQPHQSIEQSHAESHLE